MITKEKYNYARIIVNAYEQNLGLYDDKGSIPFSEYHEFTNWLEDEGWFEAANDEFDNKFEPNSAVRLSIKELYILYKQSH